MVKLELAVKAPLVAYPALTVAELGNHLTAESPVTFSVVDEKEVAANKVASIDGKAVSTTEAVNELLALFASKGVKLSVDPKWAELAYGPLQSKNFKETMPILEQIESFLNFRSFFEPGATSPGATDAVVWGALRANAVVGAACKNGTYINLARWYRLLDAHRLFGGAVAAIQEQIKEARHAAKLATTRKKESKASFDIDLVDAEDGKVVTRFPPEPSGFMHIGHAKAAILNEYFARMYHGKLIVRFDDTNPSKEKEEYTDAILKDIGLLGIKPDQVTYSSDYFDHMYKLAVQMIKDGLAYCDDTPQETMREQRGEGIASARRDRSVEENLRVFDEMKNGTEEGLRNCVRAKISVDDNNKTLRDPVVYRCNLTPHVRTGSTWKMYPTYDFCSPVVDAVEGVTHALRTNEYRDRNAQYAWMLNALKLRTVHIWDFSRINFVRTLLSKRKLQWFVDTGRVSGWDDPRFPTVSGVRRRGMSVEGLRQFILQQGPSRNILNLDWSLIWNVNKKVIDPVAPRYVAIEQPTKFVLTDDIPCHQEQRALHKKNADVGTKQIWLWNKLIIEQDDALTLKEGEELTLMDWGNVVVDKIERDGEAVAQITGHLHLEGDFKKTEHKLTWLADTPDLAHVDLHQFDHLITKEKLEEDDKFEDFLTPQTVFVTKAVADHNVAKLPEDSVIQFERKGYYRVDVAAKDGQPATLFGVPDGKVVSRYGAKK